MKIIHIVPEFQEGGVERYVLQLCHEQVKHGHHVTLATAGGKLERFLPENNMKVIHLPVHRKNIFTGIHCVRTLSKINDWDIIHAHSRVPAWIAWRTSIITKTSWVMTAHAPYSLNIGIKPFRHADGVICVSESVREELKGYLPENTITIPNGIRKPSVLWEGKYFPENRKFLYVGYLARRKGLDTVFNALGQLKHYDWTLDVVGDGSQKHELESLAESLGISERIKFYGFRDDTDEFMSKASCLLFPSHSEGFGLVVAEALAVGLPVLASDLEPLRPFSSGSLLPHDDVSAWTEAIERVINGGSASPLSADKLIMFEETAQRTEDFYRKILDSK
jgi:glycosyltransferase involved in cell wall biosynthesis